MTLSATTAVAPRKDQSAKQDLPLVIQFSKWPQPGEVKTRLIPDLGAMGAMQAHISLSMVVLRNLAKSQARVELWWDSPMEPPAEAKPLLNALDRLDVPTRIQRGSDLGARMLDALNRGLLEARKVILVGSDCPSVDADYIGEAVRQLDTHDVVLGPADDGGFVLIGARKTDSAMFNGVAWGGDQACEQTAQQVIACHLMLGMLETRWDVDDFDGWDRFERWRRQVL